MAAMSKVEGLGIFEGVVNGQVYLAFEQPVTSLQLTPQQAWDLASHLRYYSKLASRQAAEQSRAEQAQQWRQQGH